MFGILLFGLFTCDFPSCTQRDLIRCFLKRWNRPVYLVLNPMSRRQVYCLPYVAMTYLRRTHDLVSWRVSDSDQWECSSASSSCSCRERRRSQSRPIQCRHCPPRHQSPSGWPLATETCKVPKDRRPNAILASSALSWSIGWRDRTCWSRDRRSQNSYREELLAK